MQLIKYALIHPFINTLHIFFQSSNSLTSHVPEVDPNISIFHRVYLEAVVDPNSGVKLSSELLLTKPLHQTRFTNTTVPDACTLQYYSVI